MHKLYDRIKEKSYTVGSGSMTLSGATPGFSPFSSVYSSGDTFFYCITNNVDYEIGIGQYGLNSLSKQKIIKSNKPGNAAVVWGTGLKEVYVTYPASNSVYSNSGLNNQLAPKNNSLSYWIDANSIGDIEESSWVSGVLSLSGIFSPNQIVVKDNIAFTGFAQNQVEPFIRNELASGTNANDLLVLSGQAKQSIGLREQLTNHVLAGPVNLASGYPTFRPLVDDDIPEIDAVKVNYIPTTPSDWANVPTNTREALDYLAGSVEYIGGQSGFLTIANNLSDIQNVSQARANLGLGTLATQNGTVTGTNTGDQDLSPLARKSNNLSDLTSASTARTNLGLGTLATQNGTFTDKLDTVLASSVYYRRDGGEITGDVTIRESAVTVFTSGNNTAASLDVVEDGSISQNKLPGLWFTNKDIPRSEFNYALIKDLDGHTSLNAPSGNNVTLRIDNRSHITVSPSAIILSPLNSNLVQQRNGTSPQTSTIASTYVSNTSYEDFIIQSQSGNDFRLGVRKGSGGGTIRALDIGRYDGDTWSSSLRFDSLGNPVFGNVAQTRINLGFAPSGTVALVGEDYLTLSGQTITARDINLSTNVSGILPIANLPFKDESDMASNSPIHIPTQRSVKVFLESGVAALIGASSEILETLSGISQAIGDDPNFASGVIQSLGEKLSKASNLSDVQSVSQSRINLGVDPSGTDNSVNVTLTGPYDYITIDGQQITRNAVDLGTDVTGNIQISNIASGINASSTSFLRGDNQWIELITNQYVGVDYTYNVGNGLLYNSRGDLVEDRGYDYISFRTGGSGYVEIENQILIFSQIDLRHDIKGNLPIYHLNSGVNASSSTYWRGDGTWASIVDDAATWGNISGNIASQTDLQSALNAKEDAFSKNTAFNKNFGTTPGTVAQGNDVRFSDPRTPTPHTHPFSEITDNIPISKFNSGTGASSSSYWRGDGTWATIATSSGVWGSISGTLSNQTDLQSALNAKANTAHTHQIVDVSGLQTALDSKAATSHTHTLSNITQSSAVSGQVPTWNGTTWVPATLVIPSGSSGGGGAWGSISGTISSQTDLQSALNAKENSFSKNTAFNKNFGSTSGTVTEGNDSRLSNARTPLSHTHTFSQITDDIPVSKFDAGTNASAARFWRGDGTWAVAPLSLGFWGSISGTLSNQTDLQTALNGKENSFTKNTGFNKNFGTTAGTVAQGNDSRFTDSRTPTSHVLATNTALGPTQTISNAATGSVLRASSSNAANFQRMVWTDIDNVPGSLLTTGVQYIDGDKSFYKSLEAKFFCTEEITTTPGGPSPSTSIHLGSGNHQTLSCINASGTITCAINAPTTPLSSTNISSAGTILLFQHGTTPVDINWTAGSNVSTITWLGDEPIWSSDPTNSIRLISWRSRGTGSAQIYLTCTETN